MRKRRKKLETIPCLFLEPEPNPIKLYFFTDEEFFRF
jgi:hypothetical protein